ncbi:hypothetical protein Scep_018491 [Stephania cephalantha]|uniref:RING-type E3 ubiquitin transferase n=1 Tax=Stephania cephalantha TaxID=152367 RepID=A0AAP0I932_9MAGN
MARDLNFLSQTPPPRDPHRSFSTVLIAVICFLGGCFLLVSYYAVLAKYCSKRRRNQAHPNDPIDTREDLDEHNPTTRVAVDHPIWLINTVGLDQTVISSIPVWKFKESEGLHLIDVNDCSVCLSEFEYGESLRVLPKCGHAFHVHCIDAWLSSHTNCPLCRAPIVAAAAATPPQQPNLSEIGRDLTNLSDLGEMEETQETRIGVLVEEEEERIGGVRRSVSMDSQSIFGFSTGVLRKVEGRKWNWNWGMWGRKWEGMNLMIKEF